MSSQGESRIDVMRAPFLEEWWDVLVRGAVAVAASAWIAMIVHASGSRGGIVPFGLAFLTIAGAFVATCVACASRRKLPGRNGGELTAERTLALGDRAAFFGFIARVL